MQLPTPAVIPLKKTGPDAERFVTHWNWFELLLYGARRVPAVHVQLAPPDTFVMISFWHADWMTGRDPPSDEQKANASVQLIIRPDFQSTFVSQLAREVNLSGHGLQSVAL